MCDFVRSQDLAALDERIEALPEAVRRIAWRVHDERGDEAVLDLLDALDEIAALSAKEE
jgi:hypothetical protein